MRFSSVAEATKKETNSIDDDPKAFLLFYSKIRFLSAAFFQIISSTLKVSFLIPNKVLKSDQKVGIDLLHTLKDRHSHQAHGLADFKVGEGFINSRFTLAISVFSNPFPLRRLITKINSSI